MKKVFSISLSFLMLAAMLQLSVATHYCHGNVAESKISLSGELASCGMECEEKDLPLPLTQLQSRCCEDVVTYYGIDNNYLPSFYVPSDSYQDDIQVFSIPVGLNINSLAVIKPCYTSVSPPGALMSTNVDLSVICVFRI